MKTVLLLSLLLCAAFAAPAEDKATSEAAVMELKEGLAAAPGLVSEEGVDPESRFNFCPSGWFTYNSRCFKFINKPLNWYNAEETCNRLGGHLASANGPQEYRVLQQLTQGAGQSQAWLGGFNLQGRWMWMDNQGFSFTSPPSYSSSSTSACLYLLSSTNWRSTNCFSGLRFICSVNPFGC